jgi:hypothetical protein
MAAEERGPNVEPTDWEKVAEAIDHIELDKELKPVDFEELVKLNMFAEFLPDYDVLTKMLSDEKTRGSKRKGTTSCRHLVILIILSKRAHAIWVELGRPEYPNKRRILSVLWRTILINDENPYPELYNFFMMNNANDFLPHCHIITSLTEESYTYQTMGQDLSLQRGGLDDSMLPCTMALVKRRRGDGRPILHVSHYFSIVKHFGINKGYSAYGSENLQAPPTFFDFDKLIEFVRLINTVPTDSVQISIFFKVCFAQKAGNFKYRDEGLGERYQSQFIVGATEIEEGIQREIDTYTEFMLAFFPTVTEKLIEASLNEFPKEDLSTKKFLGGRLKKRRFKSQQKHRYRKIKSRTNKRKSHKHKNYKN